MFERNDKGDLIRPGAYGGWIRGTKASWHWADFARSYALAAIQLYEHMNKRELELQRAAENLDDESLQSLGTDSPEDYTLSFLYLARHSVELLVKMAYYASGELVGTRKELLHGHTDLLKNWMKAKPVLLENNITWDESFGALEQLATLFDRIDPGSMENRYPVDTKGAPTKGLRDEKEPDLNLSEIAKWLTTGVVYSSYLPDELEQIFEARANERFMVGDIDGDL